MIDGIDVRELTFESLANAVGVVSQETYLFHATVRDNLRFARSDATDEEVEEAARAAQIKARAKPGHCRPAHEMESHAANTPHSSLRRAD